ncbi:MAG: type II toxin-antitoxin system RelE/ParE family toxin [Thermodesulfobacteriota bacterium]
MIFIETTIFTKLIEKYLTDDEYSGLQGLLLEHPETGKVIPGSGGVRKIRWAKQGRGKRGGIRVIYYLKKHDNETWMLTVYGKSEKSNIPTHILKKIAEEIKND